MKSRHSNREGLRERPLLSPSVLSSLDTILAGTSCHWAGVVFPEDSLIKFPQGYFQEWLQGKKLNSSETFPLPIPGY